MIRIIQGDALEKLKGLPAESVHMCVTSPPYWGLRDYGVAGQLGLEKTPEEYVDKMVGIFREVKRVLRDDGTLWINMGDCYSCSKGKLWDSTDTKPDIGWSNRPSYRRDRRPREDNPQKSVPGLAAKNLVGMPWRIAFALQADGWYLRSDIIWHKPNPMPESATDRPTKSHEYIFLLSKSRKYYYDAEAIREDGPTYTRKASGYKGFEATHIGNNQKGGLADKDTTTTGRNKSTVWTIATRSYTEAHFATFPPDLILPCILAGTSERGCCPECGASWERVVEKKRSFESGSGKSGNMPIGKHGANLQGGGETKDIRRGPCLHTNTLGWRPTCDHYPEVDSWQNYPRQGKDESDEDYESRLEPIRQERSRLLMLWEPLRTIPCTVFDPFFGAGTTGLVANQEGRDCIGIELSQEYCDMAEKRIKEECPLFTEIIRE